MDLPDTFAHRIQASDDFNVLLMQHYIRFSDGATMVGVCQAGKRTPVYWDLWD
tara:strand:- start:29513 stop:29671 length:159 start_codon:yes stop_codon:yes gene_type:complete